MNALGCNRSMIIHNSHIFFMIHSSIYILEPHRCHRAGSHCFLPHWSGSYRFLLHSSYAPLCPISFNPTGHQPAHV